MFRQQGKKSRVAGRGLQIRQRAKLTAAKTQQNIAKWLGFVLLILLILVPSGLFIWLLTSTNTFTVENINVVDAREHTAKQVEQLLGDQIRSLSFGDNIFFISGEVLENKVLDLVPQVKTVHITKKLPSTLKVVVQEKEAKMLLLATGDYYLVDQNGIPYEEARLELLPGNVLPIVKNNSENQIALGTPAFTPEFVQLVGTLQKEIPETINAEVAEIRIPSVAAEEVYFILTNNWEIRFDGTRSAASQLGILRRLLNEIIDEQIAAGLEYIDLRIPNRIYYKTRTPSDERI